MKTWSDSKLVELKKTVCCGGFTLIELMITIAILGIGLTIAIPSYQSATSNSRLSGISGNFVASLNFARQEALKLGQRVTVCRSAGATACATSGGWDQGYIVFADSGTIGSFESGTETVLRHQQQMPDAYTMSGNNLVATYVSFTSRGVPRTSTSALQSGTFSLCGPDSYSRAIVISTTGRIAVNTTGASCS